MIAFSFRFERETNYTIGMDMTKEKLKCVLDSLFHSCREAKRKGEIPVAAAVIDDSCIYIDHNDVEHSENPFRHAEILAMEDAMLGKKTKYLKGCSLIVTLEPCLMCMGAILKAGVDDLYYVTDDLERGALSYHHVFVDNVMRVHRIHDERFDALLSNFFTEIRKKKAETCSCGKED